MSLSAAILGFLAIEPTTGYTLKQRFEGSVGSFWTVTQSQIYRELHGLQRGGQVKCVSRPQDGKPAQKIYSLTDAGQRALQAWLGEPIEPLQLRHPMLLKFVFAEAVAPDRLDRQLAAHEEALQQQHGDYRARLNAAEIFSLARSAREAALWRLAVEHGIEWCRMELAWIKRARSQLKRAGASARKRRGK